jgi:cytochrome c553
MVHSNQMRGTSETWKLIALIVSAVFALVAVAVAATYLVSEQQLNANIKPPNESIVVPRDIAAAQHGQHLAGAIALCTRCHAANLTGAIIEDDASARVVAPNITRGGSVAAFTDADYARAIRDGISRDGHALWLMPTSAYSGLSDADLGSLITYLKSLPPVRSALPPDELRPLGRLRLVTGQLALISGPGARQPAPPPDVTPAYGEYLVTIAGCARCHGPTLSGGVVPDAPRGAAPASSLTSSGLGNWSEADFVRAMRTGRRPDGSSLDTLMPWPYYAQMSDLELRAIWQYLGVLR